MTVVGIALGDQPAEVDGHEPVDHGKKRVDDVLDPDDADALGAQAA